MKTQYSYTVNGITFANREAARVVQRSLRASGADKESTKIIQRITISQVIR